MKTRTAFVYLAVVAVLGAYFYYFEVVRQKSRTEKQEAALRLFQIDKDSITSAQLDKGHPKSISMRKNGRWHIVEPIHSPADEFAVKNLLTSLTSLKMERQVKNGVDDLQPYGLERPHLQVSFLADGRRHHLRIGDKAAVGDQYYASGDQKNRVVLIGDRQQQSLNKSLFDLRNKEFFTINSDEVTTIVIERAENELVIKKADGERWQSEAEPHVKIKSSKVDALLKRLLWLRAESFLGKEVESLAQLGLAPARIRVSLSSREETESLLIGASTRDHAVYATGDGLTGIALVAGKLLKQVPASLADLQDRTLLFFELDQVDGLKFQLDGHTYRLKRYEEKWSWADDQGRIDPENWRVNSLLWKLQDLEYLPDDAPEKRMHPEDPHLRLELLSGDEKLGTFLLGEVPGDEVAREALWFAKGSEPPQPYWLDSESLRELHEDVEKLLTPESQETRD